MPILFSMIVAFLVTCLSITLLRPLAEEFLLVDRPNRRKHHQGHVPLIGGLGIFIGFVFALLTVSFPLEALRPLLAAAGILMFIGVLDDFSDLSARSRLIAQLLAALLVTAWGGVMLHQLGYLAGPAAGMIVLAAWALPVTVIAIMGMINAANMIDGLDGLAGGIGFVQLSLMAWLAHQAHLFALVDLLLLLMAAMAAFLMFNFPFWPKRRARVFLGDAGSMLVGLVLAWLAIVLSQHGGQGEQGGQTITPVTLLWVMAVPLFDLVAAMIRRLWKRQSPFQADRGHFHHIFELAGYSRARITYAMCSASLVLGVTGILMTKWQVPEWLSFVLFVCVFVLYFWILVHAWRFMKWVRRNS